MWLSIYLALAVLVQCVVVNCNQQTNEIQKGTPSAFFNDCLIEINKYRKLHSAYSLRWSADLQYHAQLRADQLANDDFLKNDITIPDRVRQGETVAYLSPPKRRCRTYPPFGDCYACRDTIALWYNQSNHYDYKTGYSNDGTKQVLDFTQVVWKDTVKVGLAIALSPQYGVITVARYHPRGNIGFVEDYVRNVAPRGAAGNGDKFDGNRVNGGQGGPPCRKLKKRKIQDCVNVYDDQLCDAYVQQNPSYCEYNKVFMKANCARSCKFCERRFPAPPVIKDEGTKKHDLRWEVGTWFKCHGGLQWRVVKCYGKENGGHYHLVKNKFCHRELGKKPVEFKDCD